MLWQQLTDLLRYTIAAEQPFITRSNSYIWPPSVEPFSLSAHESHLTEIPFAGYHASATM